MASSIEASAYYQALKDFYLSDREQRLGQWLANRFSIQEEQAPGLWQAEGMDAECLFFKHFHLH